MIIVSASKLDVLYVGTYAEHMSRMPSLSRLPGEASTGIRVNTTTIHSQWDIRRTERLCELRILIGMISFHVRLSKPDQTRPE